MAASVAIFFLGSGRGQSAIARLGFYPHSGAGTDQPGSLGKVRPTSDPSTLIPGTSS